MFFLCVSAWHDARAALSGAPRDLWLALVPMRLLGAAAYYTLASIFVGFIERAFHFTDATAPVLFGVWGGTNTLFTFIGGWVCDGIGVRLTLMLGSIASCGGFIILALSQSTGVPFWLATYLLIPIGVGFTLPVCDVAVRRYSTPAADQIVYPLAYAVSTLGQCIGLAMLAAISAIYIEESHRRGKTHADLENDTSAERYVFMACAIGASLIGIISRFYLKDRHVAEVYDIETNAPVYRWWSTLQSFVKGFRSRMAALRHNGMFGRVALMVLLTLPARHVFILLYTTLSIYLRRTLGVDAPVYAFMMIDPALETLLAPLFAIFMPQFDIYYMIVVGATISSCGLLGFLLIEPTYLSVGLTLTAFAIGSAMYVPRVQQYVLVLAPDGHEGQFAAFASTLPILLGKIIVGLVFGSLLDSNCPERQLSTTSRCAALWYPSVVASFLTPLCMVLFSRYIHTDEVRAHFDARLATLRALHVG